MSLSAGQLTYLLGQCVTARKNYLHRRATLLRHLTLTYPDAFFTNAEVDSMVDALGRPETCGLAQHLAKLVQAKREADLQRLINA